MPSSTGYSQNIYGNTVPDSGLPAVGGAIGSPILARAHYDFAVQGGAVGTIALLGALAIPAKSMIMGGFVRVTTLLTSGGAGTAAIQVESAGDMVAAAAVSGAPWSTTGTKAIIPVYTAATMVLTTAARDISLVIATAALTAGVFDVYLVYVPVLA